jgi:hypothetical protein
VNFSVLFFVIFGLIFFLFCFVALRHLIFIEEEGAVLLLSDSVDEMEGVTIPDPEGFTRIIMSTKVTSGQ